MSHLAISAPTASSRAADAEMQARAHQDAARIMAAITDPTTAVQAAVSQCGIDLEEWDTSTLSESLREGFCAFYLEHKDGTRIIVVPAGQDPVIRLAAVRAILAHSGVTA